PVRGHLAGRPDRLPRRVRRHRADLQRPPGEAHPGLHQGGVQLTAGGRSPAWCARGVYEAPSPRPPPRSGEGAGGRGPRTHAQPALPASCVELNRGKRCNPCARWRAPSGPASAWQNEQRTGNQPVRCHFLLAAWRDDHLLLTFGFLAGGTAVWANSGETTTTV